MRLAVVSHKVCWAPEGGGEWRTDGGFPFQMAALAELFDATTLVLPASSGARPKGAAPLAGRGVTVAPLTVPGGSGVLRKALLPGWLVRNAPTLLREIRGADVVHAPIPGDVGTIGLLLALLLRKRIFVRHCGNWTAPRTAAEHFWRWLLRRIAGPGRVVLATGGAATPPDERNAAIRWIFSTSLAEEDLAAHARTRAGFPPGAPRLVHVARQDPEKGAGIVLESLALLRRDFPGIRLEVVGDGPAIPAFRETADRLGETPFVTFHGPLAHAAVLERLHAADVFCFPTMSSEGFPKAVLEALACGLPVVTTRVSVLPVLLAKGGGVLVDAASPAAVAGAVREVLASDETYRTFSARATATAREFSLERWRDTIGSLMRNEWGELRARG